MCITLNSVLLGGCIVSVLEHNYTSSVDNEHEFLAEVSRVGSLPERLHHQVGGWICVRERERERERKSR
jgi:hypothetical protein